MTLTAYALQGLQNCWLPDAGRWSSIYHLDGRHSPNESIPASDVYYTLNVLLGLARVRHVPAATDVSSILQRNALSLLSMPVRPRALGMALWASAELGLDLPGPVKEVARRLLQEKSWRFRAQDIGLLLTGAAAQAEAPWSALADALFKQVVQRYTSRSGLFFDAASGPRRRFTSFATHTYLILACYRYGTDQAIDIANACVRTLLKLQGPDGEWPWFFDTVTGRILDYYEVYTVHQGGMAPAFLECAARHGVTEARAALVRGFRWVLGQNQLGRVMLAPDRHLTIRSQCRKGELKTRQPRAIRSIRYVIWPGREQLIDPARIALRLECRSYELGWMLWSFGGRADLPELTDHALFAQ